MRSGRLRTWEAGGVGSSRTPAEVVQDHLMRWRNRDLAGDLTCNYGRDVLTVTGGRAFIGWSGPQRLEAELESRVPHGRLMIDALRLGGDVAVVAWSLAEEDGGVRVQGVDSYFIRRGRILTQTRETRCVRGDRIP